MTLVRQHVKFTQTVTILLDNDDDDPSELDIVIGGAVGGAVLSVIICVFFIVVFWMRRSFSNLFSNREEIKMGSDIKMTSNPSYDIIKQTIKEEIVYDRELFKSSETNPSYGMIQEYNRLCHNSDNAVQSRCNDATQPNSSCSGTSKSSREMYEDQDGYVKTDLTDVRGTHYLEIMAPTTQEENPTVNGVAASDVVSITNPSYNLMSGGVILEDNPSYNKITFTQSQ